MVTAVYILRVVAIMLMGPVKNESYNSLPKITWYEKLGIVLLLVPIVAIGIAPLWLSDLIFESLHPFIQGVLQ